MWWFLLKLTIKYWYESEQQKKILHFSCFIKDLFLSQQRNNKICSYCSGILIAFIKSGGTNEAYRYGISWQTYIVQLPSAATVFLSLFSFLFILFLFLFFLYTFWLLDDLNKQIFEVIGHFHRCHLKPLSPQTIVNKSAFFLFRFKWRSTTRVN